MPGQRTNSIAVSLITAVSLFLGVLPARGAGEEVPLISPVEQERLVVAKLSGTPGDSSSTTEFGPWLGTAFVHEGGQLIEWYARAVQASFNRLDSLWSSGEVEIWRGSLTAKSEHRFRFELSEPTGIELSGFVAVTAHVRGDGSVSVDVNVNLIEINGPLHYSDGVSASGHGTVDRASDSHCLATTGNLAAGIYELTVRASASAHLYHEALGEYTVRLDFGPPDSDIPLSIVSSDPWGGAIDARQDLSADGDGELTGYKCIKRVAFSNAVEDAKTLGPLTPESFELVDTAGTQPQIVSVKRSKCSNDPGSLALLANSYDVYFSNPITPGEWTTLMAHVVDAISGERIETDPDDRISIGFLPGDADGSGRSAPSDILRLVDHLNGVYHPPMELWQCDIDRSGVCRPPDILRLIDLLNGVNTSQPWLNVSLPPGP